MTTIKTRKPPFRKSEAKIYFHQSPLFQKLLIVVLFAAAVSVVYVRAATNIGNNIITEGTLSVTGTTTLSSVVNVSGATTLSNTLVVNGPGTDLSSFHGSITAFTADNSVGLKIAGADTNNVSSEIAGTGISISDIASGGYGLWLANVSGTGKGFFMDWIDTTARGISIEYIEGTGIFLDTIDYDYAKAIDIDMSGTGTASTTGVNINLGATGSETGINIVGTTGTSIRTTRPILIDALSINDPEYPFEIAMATNGYGIVLSSNISGGAYGIHIPGTISGDNTTAFHIGNEISNNAIGVFIGGVEGTGRGIQQYLGGYTGDAGTGVLINFANNDTVSGNEGIGLDLAMGSGNALNKGINISGTVGLGIVSTRPVDLGGAGALEIPNGTDLPATCNIGEIFQDTNDDDCSDSNVGDGVLCICKSANTWAVVSNF